jgi:hypothetical protein
VEVDFPLGFDGIYLEREDGALEKGKFGVGLEDPRAVDGVGVREEDEAVTCGVKDADALPHGFVRCKYVPPSLVECFMRRVGT